MTDKLGNILKQGDSIVFQGWGPRPGAKPDAGGFFYGDDVLLFLEVGIVQSIEDDTLLVTTGDKIYMPDPKEVVVADKTSIWLHVSNTYQHSDYHNCSPYTPEQEAEWRRELQERDQDD